ncbi:MAG: Hsp20/alpha crystallin family protein [Syntrophobacteraceae bacterium]|jgi:HSP20 family protein|nr:Hsp20/alpha crystallin family protein [Syntrophobacteraceae bacterium]
MTDKDLQAREKVEVTTEAESTRNVPVYVPAVDIFESRDALVVVADMPGVSPDNVTIDVHDNTLTIRGTVAVEEVKERVHIQEYGVGDYSRQFTLGRVIDQSKIEAAMKNGVLTLTLPKSDISKPRKISVKVA